MAGGAAAAAAQPQPAAGAVGGAGRLDAVRLPAVPHRVPEPRGHRGASGHPPQRAALHLPGLRRRAEAQGAPRPAQVVPRHRTAAHLSRLQQKLQATGPSSNSILSFFFVFFLGVSVCRPRHLKRGDSQSMCDGVISRFKVNLESIPFGFEINSNTSMVFMGPSVENLNVHLFAWTY